MGYVTGAVTPCIAYDVWAHHYMLTSMASSISIMAMAGALVGMIQTGFLKDCPQDCKEQCSLVPVCTSYHIHAQLDNQKVA